MVNRDFFQALDDLEKERRINKEALIEAIEAGLVSAYKKEFGESRGVAVRMNPEKATIKVYAYREVVDEITDRDKQITLEEAREIDPSYKTGSIITEEIVTKDLTRIAAQTAKQVIMQKLNDIKKDMILNEMSDREGEIMTAVVRRKDGDTYYVEMSNTQLEGVLMPSDQIASEKFGINETIKVYVKKIRSAGKLTQVIVSRSSAGFVRRLFELEVPEIGAGLVTIKAIVREPGYRTKMAVYSDDINIDAVGACIGNKGTRINAVVDELGGEKIDVILWSENLSEFVSRALSPAKPEFVKVDETQRVAKAIVPDDKISLAIGKSGQNARLAAKLTNVKIDVRSYSAYLESLAAEAAPPPDGEIMANADATVMADEEIMASADVAMLTDGEIIPDAGKEALADEKTIADDGGALVLDGKIMANADAAVMADEEIIASAGIAMLTDGEIIPDAGKEASADEKIVADDGAALATEGKFTADENDTVPTDKELIANSDAEINADENGEVRTDAETVPDGAEM
ncbi:MAG: transcription termination factor NusA [Clostridiales bacterium]|jgi:N utilization substance protein A|nr:transcription termination factor NusA [Clostridiales bacterium]